MKKLLSFFFCCFLLLGIQQTSTAQIFVLNNTPCGLWILSGEVVSPCTACGTATPVFAPGGGVITQIATPSPLCAPELWRGIAFSQTPTFTFGTGFTYNPAPPPFPFTCSVAPNFSGLCGLSAISGTFTSPGGIGPQLVTIN